MKQPRRITLYMFEDVETPYGIEEQRVAHCFSPEEAIAILTATLQALAKVLTRSEAKNLAENLVQQLRQLQLYGETEGAASSILKIHEAL